MLELHLVMVRPINSRNRTYIDSLDGVRAIAILGVFALHLASRYFPGGAFGVDVFFVLSAYLITSILLHEQRRNRRIDFYSFYWRRAFRLGPALLLWLLLFATTSAALSHTMSSSMIWSTAGVIFYFSDFLEAWTRHIAAAYDQSWSLAVEEQFYLVWPFVLSLLTVRLGLNGQRRAVVGLVAGSLVIAFTADNYFLPTGHLAALSLGCWAAFYAASPVGRLSTLLRDPRLAWACGLVFVIVTFVTLRGKSEIALALLVDLAATALILHCSFTPESVPSRLLAHPLLRWVGERSYGVYLYGLTLIGLVPLVTHLSLHFAAPVDIILTGLVVAASYRYVEAPLRARGRLWLARRTEDRSSREWVGWARSGTNAESVDGS